MPLFYIDTEDAGQASTDDEGIEFPDLAAARDAAISILPNIASDVLPDGGNREFKSSVRDASGKVVFRACLTLRSGYVV